MPLSPRAANFSTRSDQSYPMRSRTCNMAALPLWTSPRPASDRAEQEGEYDAETRWAIAWFEEYAMNDGPYGRAETLSKAKNVAIESLVNAGFLEAKAGKVRLLKREELSKEWNTKTNARLTVWEVMQRMIHALLNGKGESEVGDISRQASEKAEIARDLAYRLYTVCERKGWAQEALAYNSLVTSWSEVSRLAQRQASDVGLWAGTYLG